MPMIVMALPIPPERLEAWRSGLAAFAGERNEEYTAARVRQGVTRQGVFLQQGPGGPMEIMVMETDDPGRVFADIATSQEPFDVDFRRFALEIYGMDLTQPLPGPPPEQVLDWSAPARV